MPMTKPVAQMRIAADLKNAEYALDEALLRQTELFATMIMARRETGSAPALGQGALMRLVKSQQTMLSAGGELARVHGNMQRIQQEELGYEDCPPGEEMAVLGVAAQKAA
ncbi:hypothetical protein [Aurantiacibacter poecillastricola]|uniref:hypothetical protein n=1 Tax=Aurantiacibacter poecillastricola TaxID=3064385 RepID=UPI00273F5471|nr:hypothetical protein [Aurantiacibacter sp. 219JJ12-13]MDP5261596.1 hypothetical protein [Aurantiacibacter sp. 219JJ12-13]